MASSPADKLPAVGMEFAVPERFISTVLVITYYL